MVCRAPKRAERKRRSMARSRRALSSTSASHSKVAAADQFLAAASESISSMLRETVVRESCCSLLSSAWGWLFLFMGSILGGNGVVLCGGQQKRIVAGQRKGIRNEVEQRGLLQCEWRL